MQHVPSHASAASFKHFSIRQKPPPCTFVFHPFVAQMTGVQTVPTLLCTATVLAFLLSVKAQGALRFPSACMHLPPPLPLPLRPCNCFPFFPRQAIIPSTI